jgi:hypothetical protein
MQVEWVPDQSVIQTIHASPRYRGGKPWFDSVAISGGDGHPVEYGQVRALFHTVINGEQQPLVLVRMYKRCSDAKQSSHYLSRRGNVMMQWKGHEFESGDDATWREFKKSYKVLLLGHLVRQEYVVPDFSEKPRENAPAKRFFVSQYKWARHAADNRSLKVLYGDKYDKGRMA